MAEKLLLRILLVEDSEDDAALLLRAIQQGGYSVAYERVETAADMKSALDNEAWDVIISDYKLPQFDAPQALAVMKESGQDLPFIIVSGTTSEENAVSSLKAGAHDFVIKGKLARLVPAIQRELKEAVERRERQQRESELEAIASVSAALRTTKTFDEMLSHLLDHTIELIHAQGGSIWLYDAANDRINLTTWRDWNNTTYMTTSVRPWQDITGLVISTGQAIISREFRNDPRIIEEIGVKSLRGLAAHVSPCIPMNPL